MLHDVGIKVADGIKVANQLTLRLGDYPGLPRWVSCNHRILIREGRRQKGQSQGK